MVVKLRFYVFLTSFTPGLSHFLLGKCPNYEKSELTGEELTKSYCTLIPLMQFMYARCSLWPNFRHALFQNRKERVEKFSWIYTYNVTHKMLHIRCFLSNLLIIQGHGRPLSSLICWADSAPSHQYLTAWLHDIRTSEHLEGFKRYMKTEHRLRLAFSVRGF